MKVLQLRQSTVYQVSGPVLCEFFDAIRDHAPFIFLFNTLLPNLTQLVIIEEIRYQSPDNWQIEGKFITNIPRMVMPLVRFRGHYDCNTKQGEITPLDDYPIVDYYTIPAIERSLF